MIGRVPSGDNRPLAISVATQLEVEPTNRFWIWIAT